MPDPNVSDVLSGYVKVRLNPEHSEQDETLFDRWGGTGYPTMLVQRDSNSSPRRTGGPFRDKKLISPRKFAGFYRLSASSAVPDARRK